MINEGTIIKVLDKNGLDNIQKVKYYKEYIYLYKFTYEFDVEELEAATAYGKLECEDSSEKIQDKLYIIPYLRDLSLDMVEEILEDIQEDMNISYRLISLNSNNKEFNEFLVAFYKNDQNEDVNLEKILEEIK